MPTDRHNVPPPAPGGDAPAAAEGHIEPRDAVLARLFREHNQELIGFLCTRLKSEQDAKEVAQEAYARLLQLDQPGAVSFLRGYLFKTAANLAIDRLRHRTTSDAVHRRFDMPGESIDVVSAEKRASEKQEAQLAADYLSELPEKVRQAFVLYRVYEMGLQDVAKAMGVTDRMVRYYVMEAMKHVRARLDEGSK